jgi:hypothetical protein
MKRLPKLSSLACALAFAAGVSLPALADSHHFGMKHHIRAQAPVSQTQDTLKQ